MKLKHLLPLALLTSVLAAQAPSGDKPAAKGSDKKSADKADKDKKDSLEAQMARQTFDKVLDSIRDAWFGEAFKDIRYVDLDGSLRVTLSAQAINAKVAEATEGQVKASAVKEGRANVKVKSTYFANTDFRTEMSGDFGHLLYSRVGNKGFLYSKEQNAYTTQVEPTPSDAPLSFMGWFQQSLNDVKSVYTKSSTFKATYGKEIAAGNRTLQTVTFYAPTSSYDVKKREQSLAETLGFWKRGRLEVAFDKANRLPYQMDFTNEAQGVKTRLEFAYDGNNKLQSLTIHNQSKGFEGPGSMRVTYGADGLPSSISGELVSQQKKVACDLNLAWGKGQKSIASVPPPGATKLGGAEMETALLVGAAANILELQRNGLNFRSFALASNK